MGRRASYWLNQHFRCRPLPQKLSRAGTGTIGTGAEHRDQIAHFFQHYKDLEKGKSVEIVRWADPEETGEIIRQAIERYASSNA